MTDSWIEDVLQAAGMFFLNPLLWLILLAAVALGYMRVKRERRDFNIRKLPGKTEFRRVLADSWLPALIVSIVLSGIGLAADAGWIVLFCAFMLIMAVSFYYQWGSPVYTAGFAFFTLLIWQRTEPGVSYRGWSLDGVADELAVTAAVAAGVLMIAEGFLIRKSAVRYPSPRLEKTSRGLRAAVFKVKSLWLLPVLLIVPGDMISAHLPYWPQFTLGSDSFSLVPVPVAIGFSQIARRQFPDVLLPKIGRSVIWTGIAVTAIGLGGLYEPVIAWAALAAGIIIRTVITVTAAAGERRGGYAASPSAAGVVVAGVLPGSPAEKLGLLPGEVIRAVNGMQVANEKELYDAIQVNAAHCRLQVADRNGEVRLMQQVLYRHDHYQLGLLLVR
ncbi:PDZ domain-containing protein [Sporosarcina trichiuri]|uniref:PDZ domain-containing protein n=1 Tax=Sporosarcina trichiuri TaxID=3056445 RepID=UPI0025B419C8|nr:PDZ domain-containing protein [Sporosarcina sp. 0.2-SM1T-5]WJY26072.1 PDZ domain-containing protein [Sporosarcina sp. 0.2-SM1T-5]